MIKEKNNNKTHEYMTLKFDLMFKKVFGDNKHKDPIKLLLKEILNIEPKEVTILNTELIDRPYRDKRVYVDLIVELEDGTKVGVEINTDVDKEIVNRNFYYMCKNISKDLIPNEDFNELPKHIQINFDFEGKHIKPMMSYKLLNNETKDELTDIIEIIRIDVPYYFNKCYNRGIDIDKLDSLTKFIGLFGVETKDQAKALCEGDSVMEEIYKRIEEYNDDLDLIGVYDYEQRQRHLNKLRNRKMLEESKQQGLKQGIEQNTLDIAKNMLKEDTDINFISKVTGLSIDKINELKESK